MKSCCTLTDEVVRQAAAEEGRGNGHEPGDDVEHPTLQRHSVRRSLAALTQSNTPEYLGGGAYIGFIHYTFKTTKARIVVHALKVGVA